MSWTKLVDLTQEYIGHGSILRSPQSRQAEGEIDLMVFDPQDPQAGMGLMAVTGQKAGLILVLLPKESCDGRAIKSRWLVDNWRTWVFPEVDVGDVLFIRRYELS
ncbi:Imm45 family immunity protein [Pseudomonas sp. EggHat1]|uniref:Imm45 family immunity protein n=1 Tax=Pseudomonas sp. EggHat1 TaxID=2761624 RepID=UPI00186650A2|nr:Imm45 family immunity protein [Pseudomonas sp. EggHat1]